MNKLVNFLLIFSTLLIFSCSKGEDDPIAISLSQNDIQMYRNEEISINIIGAEASECKLYVEDDFIAYGHIYGGCIHISSSKVGETDMIVSCGPSEAQCHIVVKPMEDAFGDPYLKFGASKSDVKSHIKGSIKTEKDNYLEVEITKVLIEHYYFKNDKLECVRTEGNTIYYDYNHIKDHSRFLSYLLERFSFLSAQSSSIDWYSHPGLFIVRAVKRGGNGGYFLDYAPSKEIMANYFNVSSNV